MKPTKDFRNKPRNFDSDDSLKRAAKLEPIKKSGKEKRALYSELDEAEEDEELLALHKRDSILDYYDDEGEDEDEDGEAEDDEDESEWEDEEQEDNADRE